MFNLLDKFYMILDSSGITLDIFCKYYNVNADDLVKCEQDTQGKIIDFLTYMEK